MAEGFDAADTALASALPIVEEWTNESFIDAAQGRIESGYSTLLGEMMRVPAVESVQGAAPDSRAQRSAGSTDRSRSKAGFSGSRSSSSRHARSVTVPLGVLQAPAGRGRAYRVRAGVVDEAGRRCESSSPGRSSSCMLRFRSAFWEQFGDGRARDASFFHAENQPFQVFWTQVPRRAPLLVAWLGGPRVTAADPHGDVTHLAKQAVQSLDSLFGKQWDVADELEAVYCHDWQRDPFARGAYSYVGVGGDARAKSWPRRSTARCSLLARRRIPTGEAATVTGALQSGERAANRSPHLLAIAGTRSARAIKRTLRLLRTLAPCLKESCREPLQTKHFGTSRAISVASCRWTRSRRRRAFHAFTCPMLSRPEPGGRS